MALKILVLPGDGIGPEITQVAVGALERLKSTHRIELDVEQRDIGLAALAQHGSALPSDVLNAAVDADGVVLAPVSTYEYPPPEQGGVNPSATIRMRLDLFANIRPARAFDGVPAPAPDIDLVVVRENTEGFYADRSMHVGLGEFMPTPDLALSVRKVSRAGSERIARAAFELAMRRRKHVTMVHKANVLRISDGLFTKTVREVAQDYPEVTLDERLIDAMTALLIRSPGDYDVVVTTNMFGDILSDEATELAGGIGLGGALNAGEKHAVAQATHGSAPDIAGKNCANPAALLLSTAMLLGWLGGRHDDERLQRASQALERAVAQALADPANHTPDLKGSNTTSGFGEAVLAAL